MGFQLGCLVPIVKINVFDYIERLKSASTMEEKFLVFATATSEMGFDQSLYGFRCAVKDQDISEDVANHSNSDLSFLTTYEDEKLTGHNVCVRHCILSNLPTPWFDNLTLTELNNDDIRLERIGVDFGFRADMAVSTREGDSELFGGFSVAKKQNSKSEFKKIVSDYGAELQLLGLCLHTDIQRTVNPLFVEDLTSREKEVLIWASLGMSSKQTARKLGIAFRTVEWHLEQARLKLSANNKIHAVSKAVACGLIML